MKRSEESNAFFRLEMPGHTGQTPASYRRNRLMKMVDGEPLQRQAAHIAPQRGGDHARTAGPTAPRASHHEGAQGSGANSRPVNGAVAEYVLEKRAHVADARHARGLGRAAHVTEIGLVPPNLRVHRRTRDRDRGGHRRHAPELTQGRAILVVRSSTTLRTPASAEMS